MESPVGTQACLLATVSFLIITYLGYLENLAKRALESVLRLKVSVTFSFALSALQRTKAQNGGNDRYFTSLNQDKDAIPYTGK